VEQPEPTPAPISQLAEAIERAGMREAAALALDVLRPVDLIGSQLAQFSRPFLSGHAWEPYAAALAAQGGLEALRKLLARE
jgi:hypothetical protein